MGNDLLLPDFELREIFLRQPYRVYSKSCSAVGEKIIVSELESLLHYKIKCNFKLMKPFLMNELQRGFCQTLRIVCGQQTTSLKKRRWQCFGAFSNEQIALSHWPPTYQVSRSLLNTRSQLIGCKHRNKTHIGHVPFTRCTIVPPRPDDSSSALSATHLATALANTHAPCCSAYSTRLCAAVWCVSSAPELAATCIVIWYWNKHLTIVLNISACSGICYVKCRSG